MAFPNTPLLDDGNRPDENPLSQGGNWTSMATVGGLRVVSNRFAVGLSNGTSYRLLELNPEAYFTVGAFGGQMQICFRWHDSGGNNPIAEATRQGYIVSFNSTNFFVWRVTAGSNSLIYGTISWASLGISFANGFKCGAQMIGSRINIFAQEVAGAWQQVGTTTDTAWSVPGAIGFRSDDTSARLDDLGGGNTLVAPQSGVSRHGIGMGRW